jgi:hypothetical protein
MCFKRGMHKIDRAGDYARNFVLPGYVPAATDSPCRILQWLLRGADVPFDPLKLRFCSRNSFARYRLL